MVGLLPDGGAGARAAAVSEGIENGTPVYSNKTVRATLRVLVATTLLAVFYTLWFVGELLLSRKWRATESDVEGVWRGINDLLFDLVVPACGYYGALYGNRHLTCCFCSCTLMLSTVAFSTVAIHLCANLHSIQWHEFNENDCKRALGTLLDLCSFWYATRLYFQLPSSRPSFLAPLVGQVILVERGASPAPASHGAAAGTAPEAAAAASPGAATRVASGGGAAAAGS